MATAEELLRTVNPENEPHIVIDAMRNIAVPVELQNIAVQYDHNIETVTFDCPRFWDGHDLSEMMVFINYMRADSSVNQYHCDDVTIDPDDETIMHFTWTISGNATEVVGAISFLVCVVTTDEAGELKNRWSSNLNQEMKVSKGMNASAVVAELEPDVIATILVQIEAMKTRMKRNVDWDQNNEKALEYIKNRPIYLDTNFVGCGTFSDEALETHYVSSLTPKPTDLVGATLQLKVNDDSYIWPVIAYCETINDAKAAIKSYGNEECLVVLRGDALSQDPLDYYISIPATFTSLIRVATNPATGIRGIYAGSKQVGDDLYRPVGLSFTAPKVDPRYESLFAKDTTTKVEVDPTLSVEGMAADAKAVGDLIGDIESILDAINGGSAEDVHYLTDDDIPSIIDKVIAQLPAAEEASF